MHTCWEVRILIHKFISKYIEFKFLLSLPWFLIGDRLYIVMELIEGVPLGEHFSSLKEKQHHFVEERLWKIFIQVHFCFIILLLFFYFLTNSKFLSRFLRDVYSSHQWGYVCWGK